MIDVKHLYLTVGVSSTILFFLREINRFLEILSKARGSSLEGRVSSVNLLLSGTVVNCSFVITENRNKIPQDRD